MESDGGQSVPSLTFEDTGTHSDRGKDMDVTANDDICFPGELRDAFLFAEFPSAKLT